MRKIKGKINLIQQSRLLFGSALVVFIIIIVTITQISLGYAYVQRIDVQERQVLLAVNDLAISIQDAGEQSTIQVVSAYTNLVEMMTPRQRVLARESGLNSPEFSSTAEKEDYRKSIRTFAGALRARGIQSRNRILISSAILLLLSFLVILFNLIISLFWMKYQKFSIREIDRGLSAVDRLLRFEPLDSADIDFSRIQELSNFFYQVNQISRHILYDRKLLEMNIHGNLNKVLESLFSSLQGFIKCDRVALAFITSNNMITAETAYTTYNDIYLHPGFSERIDQTSLQALKNQNLPRIIPSLSEYVKGKSVSRSTALLLKEKIQSNITIPLFFNDNCVGFLFISTREKTPYTSREASDVQRVVNIMKQKLYIEFILQETISETSRAFVSLMSEKDNETSLHIQRMSNYSYIIASTYSEIIQRQTPRFLRELLWYAPLHDIGKIGTPDAILQKPASLTQEEISVMREHVLVGERIMESMNSHLEQILSQPLMRSAVDIIACHHEKWDGSGYPRGLSGTDIPLSGRIVAAADVFDALSSKRSYKDAYSLEKSLSIMKANMIGHFDPQILHCLEVSQSRIREVYEKMKEV